MNRRFLWSLLLAFLLPLAQVGAAAHEVSHIKAPPASVHCDECAIAAAVSGGGAVSSPAPLFLADVCEAKPLAPAAGSHPSSRFSAFRSRAPPSSN